MDESDKCKRERDTKTQNNLLWYIMEYLNIGGTVQTFLHTSLFCNDGWEVLNHGIRRVAAGLPKIAFLGRCSAPHGRRV